MLAGRLTTTLDLWTGAVPSVLKLLKIYSCTRILNVLQFVKNRIMIGVITRTSNSLRLLIVMVLILELNIEVSVAALSQYYLCLAIKNIARQGSKRSKT